MTFFASAQSSQTCRSSGDAKCAGLRSHSGGHSFKREPRGPMQWYHDATGSPMTNDPRQLMKQLAEIATRPLVDTMHQPVTGSAARACRRARSLRLVRGHVCARHRTGAAASPACRSHCCRMHAACASSSVASPRVTCTCLCAVRLKCRVKRGRSRRRALHGRTFGRHRRVDRHRCPVRAHVDRDVRRDARCCRVLGNQLSRPEHRGPATAVDAASSRHLMSTAIPSTTSRRAAAERELSRRVALRSCRRQRDATDQLLQAVADSRGQADELAVRSAAAHARPPAAPHDAPAA